MAGESSDPGPENVRLLSVRLKPHRSLTRRNFRLLMLFFASASFFSALPFMVLGAWPIVGFVGMNIVIFYIAFRVNFRAARAYEDLEVTFFELLLAKVSAKGQRSEWRFNPSFVRLEQDRHEEFGTQRLALMSRGQSVEIAAFLGPAEKAELAASLSQALMKARQGPRFS
jgi:uncharacterized membrane protein